MPVSNCLYSFFALFYTVKVMSSSAEIPLSTLIDIGVCLLVQKAQEAQLACRQLTMLASAEIVSDLYPVIITSVNDLTTSVNIRFLFHGQVILI